MNVDHIWRILLPPFWQVSFSYCCMQLEREGLLSRIERQPRNNSGSRIHDRINPLIQTISTEWYRIF
uniref:Uncharacterized protein MANES_03G032900 n=1 Tax=Rhizophora mucronata TaxID=61149 RepID=A0A2P2IMI9_RHIMU